MEQMNAVVQNWAHYAEQAGVLEQGYELRNYFQVL